MTTTTNSEIKKGPIVQRVSLVDSFREIEPGTTVSYNCAEAGKYQSAACAVSRLNAEAGWTEYKISTPDNGATIVISRLRQS